MRINIELDGRTYLGDVVETTTSPIPAPEPLPEAWKCMWELVATDGN